MRSDELIIAVSVLSITLIVASLMLSGLITRREKMTRRIKMSRGVVEIAIAKGPSGFLNVWKNIVLILGGYILRIGLFSSKSLSEAKNNLISAGFTKLSNLQIFIGSKIILLILFPSIVSLLNNNINLSTPLLISIIVASSMIGVTFPDYVIRYGRKRYLRRVETGLPDALDLMIICAEAGLGLSATIAKVAQEMQAGRQDIGLEFAITANELRLTPDAQVALSGLGNRTGIEGLMRLGTTLIQSLQYGTPLAEAMRQLSTEMRQQMLTRFENKAARLGVLLTLPMILFILPCVFLIVGGPVIVQILRMGLK